MIPLRDTLTVERTPWVNRTILALNVVVFAVQVAIAEAGEIVIGLFGFIPARLFNPEAYGYSVFEVGVTLITSLFLHGGYVHLVGNLIYLAIFGNDIEDALGHVRYAVFYLLCGAGGSIAHALVFPASTIPSIGASGSIAGILGAFLLLHTTAKIVTLFPLVVSWVIAEIPALVYLPIWFVMQFANGWLALASARSVQEVAGVAWWAHIGGFAVGVFVGAIAAIRARRRRRLTSADLQRTARVS